MANRESKELSANIYVLLIVDKNLVFRNVVIVSYQHF